MPPNEQTTAVPAQLSLLAIYNPSLGTTDETLADQIVYYFPKSNSSRSPRKSHHKSERHNEPEQQNEHEKLRQVGLAQGLVSFAKNFSNGESVDSVETEKSRVVLHELEEGWWILARIDLTRLPPGPSALAASQTNSSSLPRPEYSSRDVAPPVLIRQQLLKAHSIFLLHHAQSLSDLYSQLSRKLFCAILERFWSQFIWNWDILLNGNPAVDILNGIKLAAGGELGIGVGEEEWGSGEREVLEDFVTRTEGLADIIVSRFGDPSPEDQGVTEAESGDISKVKYSWVGSDNCPGPYDGVIFSGIGAVSRPSLARLSHWMEWIYRYGEDAYGVREDPTSIRRRRRRKALLSGQSRGRSQSKRTDHQTESHSAPDTPRRRLSPGIPPPLVVATDKQAAKDSAKLHGETSKRSTASSPLKGASDAYTLGTETFMKLLTLGYGSAWGNNSSSLPSHPRITSLRDDSSNSPIQEVQTPRSEASSAGDRGAVFALDESPGYFILGLRDSLECVESEDEGGIVDNEEVVGGKGPKSNRILLRTLSLKGRARVESSDGIRVVETPKKYRAVVYLYQPFMFTFLFETETSSLSSASYYRRIHHQLGPLQKPLLFSTSRDKIQQRLSASGLSNAVSVQQQIYDLIFDSKDLTVHASLPNIPEPLISLQKAPGSQWQRLDALNVHTQLINTYIETRNRPSEIERTCKTNRGWWVLWMRLRDRQATNDDPKSTEQPVKEAFLVRKASDYAQPGHNHRKSGGSGFFRSLGGPSISMTQQGAAARGGGWSAPGKIAEGVGLDARRYIEALLSLSR